MSVASSVAKSPDSCLGVNPASHKYGLRLRLRKGEKEMNAPQIVVGIDVAKAQLDVALLPGDERWQLSNDEAGIAELISRIALLRPGLIVLEATGGYELSLTLALSERKLPVVVANPRQVRDFARATGQLAKTDRLDAEILARFGEQVRPEPRLL